MAGYVRNVGATGSNPVTSTRQKPVSMGFPRRAEIVPDG
jgi:hypothetical protein